MSDGNSPPSEEERMVISRGHAGTMKVGFASTDLKRRGLNVSLIARRTGTSLKTVRDC